MKANKQMHQEVNKHNENVRTPGIILALIVVVFVFAAVNSVLMVEGMGKSGPVNKSKSHNIQVVTTKEHNDIHR